MVRHELPERRADDSDPSPKLPPVGLPVALAQHPDLAPGWHQVSGECRKEGGFPDPFAPSRTQCSPGRTVHETWSRNEVPVAENGERRDVENWDAGVSNEMGGSRKRKVRWGRPPCKGMPWFPENRSGEKSSGGHASGEGVGSGKRFPRQWRCRGRTGPLRSLRNGGVVGAKLGGWHHGGRGTGVRPRPVRDEKRDHGRVPGCLPADTHPASVLPCSLHRHLDQSEYARMRGEAWRWATR